MGIRGSQVLLVLLPLPRESSVKLWGLFCFLTSLQMACSSSSSLLFPSQVRMPHSSNFRPPEFQNFIFAPVPAHSLIQLICFPGQMNDSGISLLKP